MVSAVRHVTFDAADPYTLARFWSAVTGYPLHPDDLPEDTEHLISPPDGAGPGILLCAVPEGKTVKNRLHLDLQPQDRTRDEEVERVLGLGATLVADHRNPDGTGWAVLADPEGNEFCVERSATERPRSP
ncbi:MAG: VOC family protein [Micromonosporaceae bacterium]